MADQTQTPNQLNIEISEEVSEGQYVQEGTQLYTVDNFSTLWVEAELYPQETSLLKVGDEVTIHVSGSRNEPLVGKVTSMTNRTSYVIDRRGRVAFVHSDLDWSEHVQKTLAAVKALKR